MLKTGVSTDVERIVKKKEVMLYPMSDSVAEKTHSKKRPQSSRASKSLRKSRLSKETDPLALYFKQISKFPLPHSGT